MIGYIARDRDGELYLYKEKHTYVDSYEGWFSTLGMICITGQFSEFDNMSYTNEPIKVEIKLERI